MANFSLRLPDELYKALKEEFGDRIDVPEDRKFFGFQGYKKAIDALRPGDVAMCTTRSYIRPLHVEYAISKGINVFMEKPFASDPGGLHRILRAAKTAEKTGSKIMAGLQCRHSPARQALIEQVRNGDLGEITLIRANRLGPGRFSAARLVVAGQSLDVKDRSTITIPQVKLHEIVVLEIAP